MLRRTREHELTDPVGESREEAVWMKVVLLMCSVRAVDDSHEA